MMRDGRVLAHHEYGFADRALGRRVDERTIFHWGSNHQDAHRGGGDAAARPEAGLARRTRDAVHPRAAPGARPVRLHGRRYHPDATVALRWVSKSHLWGRAPVTERSWPTGATSTPGSRSRTAAGMRHSAIWRGGSGSSPVWRGTTPCWRARP